MISRKPYFKPKKKSRPYFSFQFDNAQEATVFREMCIMLGMKTDKKEFTGKYKTVVYILDVESVDDSTDD